MREEMRTRTSQAGVDLSAQFASAFSTVRVHGDADRVGVLREPEELSTGGGARARQALMLWDPVGGTAPVTVGWVNLREHVAHLRTHTCLAELHLTRFGNDVPLPVERESYEHFVALASDFFRQYGMRLEMEALPPKVVEKPKDRTTWLLIVLALAIAALLGMLFLLR